MVHQFGAGTQLADVVFLPMLKDGAVDHLSFRHKTPELKAEFSGDALPEAVELIAVDGEFFPVHELNVADSAVCEIAQELNALGALDLKQIPVIRDQF